MNEAIKALEEILNRFYSNETIHDLECDDPNVARPCLIEGKPSYFTDKQILKYREILKQAKESQQNLVEFKVCKDSPDLAYVNLTPPGLDRSGIVDVSVQAPTPKGLVVLDFDKDGKVVGIELIGLSYREQA